MSGKRDGCECGWGKTRSEKYGLILDEYTPMKMFNASIADIITKMERVSTEDMDPRERCYRYHEPISYRQTFLETVDTLSKESSICITYVRSLGVPEM